MKKFIKFSLIGSFLLLALSSCVSGQESALKELEKHKIPFTDAALRNCIEEDDLKTVKLFLKAGKNVNAKDQSGLTALHCAAANSRREIAELLISKGANVNAKATDGLTPLHYAASGGHSAMVEFLISKGADVNAKNDMFGWTPLHMAIIRGRRLTTELLISKGANVNARTSYGQTPLHYAAGFADYPPSKPEIVELLISKGADINAKDKDGKTPLSWAKKQEIIDLLKRHGARK